MLPEIGTYLRAKTDRQWIVHFEPRKTIVRRLVGSMLLAGILTGLAPEARAATCDEKGPARFACQTSGSKLAAGFFDLHLDQASGRVLLAAHTLDSPFLLSTAIGSGLGAPEIDLYRGKPGDWMFRMVEFRRTGNRLMLVQTNPTFRSTSANASEQAGVRNSFPESVLWSGEVLGEESRNLLVDFSNFVLSDQFGIGAELSRGKCKFHLEDRLSALDYSQSRSFPENTDLEAALTFSSGEPCAELQEVLPTNSSNITIHQHISFVKLPDSEYRPRVYHPFSGGFDMAFSDFSRPFTASLEVRYQNRFRLQRKIDGTVRNPLVYYVDRSAPPDIQSALAEGAGWWSGAFEKAGFRDGFRVQIMPEHVDPMDVRSNVILWGNRSGRGRSCGNPLIDPRTGEIIRGMVFLDAERIRETLLIAQTLLAPFGKPNQKDLEKQAKDVALARVRQLVAHEVGHTLGFRHNFAGSRMGNGSVMDYPYPTISIRSDGSIDLSKSYAEGLGPWDDYLVKHAYSEFGSEEETLRGLAALRHEAIDAGMRYISDGDAGPSSAQPDAIRFDFGKDTLEAFDQIMKVRRKALEQFSLGVLPPERQVGELEERLARVYMLHRYQIEALAAMLGGADYSYSTGADKRNGTRPVAALRQREALKRLERSLQAEELSLPPNVVDILTPPGAGYGRTREYLATNTTPLFDPLSAAEVAGGLICKVLFNSSRLNRLESQSLRDPSQLSVPELLKEVFSYTWQHHSSEGTTRGMQAIQLSINWVVLDAVLGALQEGNLHPMVEADIRSELIRWQVWLTQNATADTKVRNNRQNAAKRIEDFLKDPRSVKLKNPLPVPPDLPGATDIPFPIGALNHY